MESKEREINDKTFEIKSKEIEAYLWALINDGKINFDCPHRAHLEQLAEISPKSFIYEMVNQMITPAMFGRDISEFTFRRSYCFECGTNVDYHFKDGLFTAQQRDCYSAEDLSVDIDVPSGKLVLDDWPLYGDEIFGSLRDMEEDINCQKGIALRTLNFQKKNAMHFFVGNTSPSVYIKDGIISIGCTEEDAEAPLAPNERCVGMVCTDLWWVTGFDYGQYENFVKRNLGFEGRDNLRKCIDDNRIVVVDVKPGTYTCTQSGRVIRIIKKEKA